jgi:hypothetical protein
MPAFLDFMLLVLCYPSRRIAADWYQCAKRRSNHALERFIREIVLSGGHISATSSISSQAVREEAEGKVWIILWPCHRGDHDPLQSRNGRPYMQSTRVLKHQPLGKPRGCETKALHHPRRKQRFIGVHRWTHTLSRA